MLKNYERTAIIWSATLESAKKLLLLALNEYLDANGQCWPGQKKLAEMCGMSLKTVSRRINEMASDGILLMRDRFDPTGRQTSSLYQVNFDQLQGGVSQSDSHKTPNTKATEGVGQDDLHGYVNLTQGVGQDDLHGYVNLTHKQIPEDPIHLTSPKESLSQATKSRERDSFVETEFRAYVAGCLRPTCKGNLTAYVSTALKNDRDDWLAKYQDHQAQQARTDLQQTQSTNPKDFAVNSILRIRENSASAAELAMRRDNFRRAWEKYPAKRSEFEASLKSQPELGLFILDGELQQFTEVAA